MNDETAERGERGSVTDPASASAPHSLRLEAGVRIGQSVVLEEKIGAGAMGEVWRGTHETLNRSVAVKIILPNALLDGGQLLLDRFEREARAAAGLESPHIVHIYDLGYLDREPKTPYIAMEFLRGESVGDRLKRQGRLPPALVQTIVQQAGKALAHAHGRGIVHRDVKPDNIFLVNQDDGDAFVKVVDFGIAKEVDATEAQHLTQTGVVLGTPAMMSPEQLTSAQNVTHQADHWALACVAYWCLSGQLPFQGDTITSIIAAIISRKYQPPSRLGLPAVLDPWFARAFHEHLGERFSTMKELVDSFTSAMAAAGASARESYPSGPYLATESLPPGPAPTPQPTMAQQPSLPQAGHTQLAPQAYPQAPHGAHASPVQGLHGHVPPLKKPISFGRFMLIAGLVVAVPGLSAAIINDVLESRKEKAAKADNDGEAEEKKDEPKKTEDEVSCERGDATACKKAGVRYFNGEEVPKDIEKAATFFEKACRQDEFDACAYLGLTHEKQKNFARANFYYEKACGSGSAAGCNYLGMNVEFGKGIKKDIKRANQLYDKSCDAGHPKGCTLRGVNYFNGEGGTKKDLTKAAALFKKACSDGEVDACAYLGLTAEKRNDVSLANKLYELACDKGSAIGCRFLGNNAIQGKGMLKDRERAIKLFEKACRAGNQKACQTMKKLGDQSDAQSIGEQLRNMFE